MGKKRGAGGGAAGGGKKKNAAAGKSLDMASREALSSETESGTTAMMPESETSTKENGTMTLTLKGLDKRGRNAIYTGAAVALRMPIGAFPSKTAPATIEVADGVLAGPKVARAKMTPEERKAARAAQPKLTLAEKVAKAEERAAKLREKLAKAPAEQPAL